METASIEALCFPTWYYLSTFHKVLLCISLCSYLIIYGQEHILETQDKAEVDRIMIKIEECKKTLLSLGYIEFTFEDFFSVSLFSGWLLLIFLSHYFSGFMFFLFTCSIFSWLFVSLSTHVTLSFRNDFGVFAWMSLLISCLMSVFVITGLVWVIVVDASRQSFETRGYAAFMWKIN